MHQTAKTIIKLLSKIYLVFFCCCRFTNCNAQGGGPPMLTDDPGVVDYHKWEINTSINPVVTKDVQLAVPYIDANYGVLHNLQLKAEIPYLFTINKQQHNSGALGSLLIGIKFHFLNEDSGFIAAGIYPQLTVTGDQKGFLFPLLLEKKIGKFVVGEDIGIFFAEHNYNNIQNGILLGFNVSNKLQVLGEYFIQKNYTLAGNTSGFVNYGFRYILTNVFTLMGSFGTQITTPDDEQRQYFISFLGVQSDF